MKEGQRKVRGASGERPSPSSAQSGRRVRIPPRAPASGLHVPPDVPPLHFQGLGFGSQGPRVPRDPSSLWLAGNHSSLLSKVFDIQIKVELVWENSLSQKPVIGARGNISIHGELMESFVAAFKEKSWEFHNEALKARLPAAVGPGQAWGRWPLT